MQLSYTMKQGTSKQEWLATVRHCPCCHSQRPKNGFRRVGQQDICEECQKDLAES